MGSGPSVLSFCRAPRTTAVVGAGSENFKKWLAAGMTGFGIGSALYKASDKPVDVARKAKETLSEYDQAANFVHGS
jgi:2-dehydro-3-deoxyphosphogalactonate aldolase